MDQDSYGYNHKIRPFDSILPAIDADDARAAGCAGSGVRGTGSYYCWSAESLLGKANRFDLHPGNRAIVCSDCRDISGIADDHELQVLLWKIAFHQSS